MKEQETGGGFPGLDIIFPPVGPGISESDLGGITISAQSSLRSIYERYGARFGVDPDLLQAIARVESNENPAAVNPNDPSTGLMQILCNADCEVCQCKNRFNVAGWDEATPLRLKDPDFNVMIGAQIIAWNQNTYGFRRGIAVYNRWESRNDPPNGPFGNQSYVDKVEREYTAIKAVSESAQNTGNFL